MIRYIIIHTALVIALLLPSATWGIKTKGSFTTQQIRMLWMGCYQGANRSNPQNPQLNGMMCDCILDKTRILYTYLEVQKKGGKVMQYEYSRLADVCVVELGFAPNPELSI